MFQNSIVFNLYCGEHLPRYSALCCSERSCSCDEAAMRNVHGCIGGRERAVVVIGGVNYGRLCGAGNLPCER